MNIALKQEIHSQEEVVLEMLQTLWVGICINLINEMVSLKVMYITNTLHIMKGTQVLDAVHIKEKSG